MIFDPPLQSATLLKRYKRFLADIRLPDGELVTIHCPNTGSMKNCQPAGARIWYSRSNNAKRKYAYTWELVEVKNPVLSQGLSSSGNAIIEQELIEQKSIENETLEEESSLVGINTGRANSLVVEAIQQGKIPSLIDYSILRTEVSYGSEKSRIDIFLENHPRQANCYIEVKNVSLGVGGGLALFPDAVTTRGHKHLRELMAMRAQGSRAMLFFCVQHTGVNRMQPADDIDPEYGNLLRQADQAGVEILAYKMAVTTQNNKVDSLLLAEKIPVNLPSL